MIMDGSGVLFCNEIIILVVVVIIVVLEVSRICEFGFFDRVVEWYFFIG